MVGFVFPAVEFAVSSFEEFFFFHPFKVLFALLSFPPNAPVAFSLPMFNDSVFPILLFPLRSLC